MARRRRTTVTVLLCAALSACSSPVGPGGPGSPTVPASSAAAASSGPSVFTSHPVNFYLRTKAMTPDGIACDHLAEYGRDFKERNPVEIRIDGVTVARSILRAPSVENGYCRYVAFFDRPQDTPMPTVDPARVSGGNVTVWVNGRNMGSPDGYTPNVGKMNLLLGQDRIPELYGTAAPTSRG